jgi:hypothetical protein
MVAMERQDVGVAVAFIIALLLGCVAALLKQRRRFRMMLVYPMIGTPSKSVAPAQVNS